MKKSLSLLSAVALLCAANVAVSQAPRPGKTVPKVGDERKAKQPPALPGKKSPASVVAQESELDYRGFKADFSQINDAPQKDSIVKAVKRQIEIVEGVNLSAENLDFFKTVPVVMIPDASGTPGIYDAPKKTVFLKARDLADNKPILLHELLHAYHHLKIAGGFQNAEINRFYEEAKNNYQNFKNEYFLSNAREFFAVTASIYFFGDIPRPPFNRSSIRNTLPEYYKYLETLFGARDSKTPKLTIGDKLDKMVAEQVEKLKVPGYAVTVIYRGDTILQKGYGFADIASKRRPDAQTVFGLASLTKTFTGLALVMLIDRGKLSLDDQLGKYVDGLAPTYQKLTIRELATMTAGLPRTLKPDDLTWENQIKKLHSEPLLSKPGSTYAYSNISYRFLGSVIEKASGESYMEFLRKNVLNPLDMTQTGPTDEHFSRPIATPYEEANGRHKPVEYKNPRVNFSAGMLASNCADLENYARALLAHDRRLLTPAGYELLWKKRWPLTNGDQNNWAFGWQSKQKQGHWLVTWNGGDPGVASLIEIYPDDQLIVIGLSNEHGQAYSIGHKIANEVLGISGGDEKEESSDN